MYERYTDRARRTVFFARYEATGLDSPTIEAEHILLGLLREDRRFIPELFGIKISLEEIKAEVESRGHQTLKRAASASIEVPLSDEAKRVLLYAAEEAERLQHQHIGKEHLLLGLLREPGVFAAKLLQERGLQLREAREIVEKGGAPGRPTSGLRQIVPSLQVTDMARSRSYYENLGFEVKFQSETVGIAILRDHGNYLALFVASYGEHLLCLHVDDAHKYAAKVSNAGATPDHASGGPHCLLLRDPSGRPIFIFDSLAAAAS